MPLALEFGELVYRQSLGLATAEVYFSKGEYKIFVVGDILASYLGGSQSLVDCIEEIKELQSLAESDDFARALSEFVQEHR